MERENRRAKGMKRAKHNHSPLARKPAGFRSEGEEATCVRVADVRFVGVYVCRFSVPIRSQKPQNVEPRTKNAPALT